MYCKCCGAQLNEQDAFCTVCGMKNERPAPVQNENNVPVGNESLVPMEENTPNQAFDTMFRMFKYERLAWKIVGIVYSLLGGLYALLGILYLVLGGIISIDDYYVGTLLFTYGFMFFAVAISFGVVGVFGLVMINKVQRYMNEMSFNIRPAIIRANSVGMIVLGALFNQVAMIFIIINFVFAKTNKSALEQIAQTQNPYAQ